jgi:hypothetical protein
MMDLIAQDQTAEATAHGAGGNRRNPLCLPQALVSLLKPKDGMAWYPPVVDAKQRAWIGGLMPMYSGLMSPAPGDELSARITALMLHFYVSALPAGAPEALLDDWCAVLADLPMWAVNAACRVWLAEKETKPKPAQIRALAVAEVDRVKEEQRKLRAILDRPPGDGEHSDLPSLLRASVDGVKIKIWAEPCRVSVAGDVVTIKAPSPFLRDGVERCLGPEIAAAYRGKSVVYAVAEGR